MGNSASLPHSTAESLAKGLYNKEEGTDLNPANGQDLKASVKLHFLKF